MYQDVRDLFDGAEELGWDGVPYDYATTLNKGHGRIERRECWAISDPSCLGYLSTGGDWPRLCSVVKVVGRRDTDTGITVQPRYYISSLDVSAERLLEGGAGPLEHREFAALELGRNIPGGPEPGAQRPWPPEHGYAEADIPQPVEAGNQPESWHPGQTAASRMARGLSAEGASRLRRDCPAPEGRALDDGYILGENARYYRALRRRRIASHRTRWANEHLQHLETLKEGEDERYGYRFANKR